MREGASVGAFAEGGCRCGAVRVAVHGEPQVVVYCHCEDCRRSSGAPVSLFAGYRAERVRTEGTPKVYGSSPGVSRSFCARCGTPLFYEDEKLPGEVYVMVGVFNDPGLFEPEVHHYFSRKPRWLHLHDDLPKHRRSGIPR